MEVQIFGVKKSPETRKAQRFFAERRIKVHFMDFMERLPSKGELQRFTQKFGIEAVLDRDAKRFADMGLGVARYGDQKWFDLMLDEPLLIRMPLVRYQHQVTVGDAEATWKTWIAGAK
jgi:arsenate reductase-like glutaredoxin family protein